MRLFSFARDRLAGLFLVLALPDPAQVKASLDEALGRIAVTRPGVVFVAPRQAAEAALPSGARAPGAPAPPAAVGEIAPQGDDGSDRRVEPMTWYVMQGIGRHLAGGPEGPAVLDALEGWAGARALETLRPAGRDGSLARSRYTLKRALLPMLAGYAVLRRDLDPPEPSRRVVEAWLGRLVALADPVDGPITAANNHRYMRDVVMLAWGALNGDEARFRDGLAGAVAAIAAMRADGAWPLEVARGRRALWYQRHALASLTAAAEIAAAQGIDLWSVEIEGRSLRHAVAWLLDALEAPAPDQDLGFLDRRGNGRHYMAWALAYQARFPDDAGARRLSARLAGAPRPLVDDYSGGDVAALVGAATAGRASGEV